MRIDELKRIAEKNNYIVQKGNRMGIEEIILKSCRYDYPETIAVINNDKENVVFFSNDVCYDSDLEMIKAAIKLAETPPEDREEEKKFYLKHRLIQTDGCYMYLQKTSDDADMMNVRIFGFKDDYDLKFTLKEIEEIKKKFDTDLKDFELVEVVDE